MDENRTSDNRKRHRSKTECNTNYRQIEKHTILNILFMFFCMSNLYVVVNKQNEIGQSEPGAGAMGKFHWCMYLHSNCLFLLFKFVSFSLSSLLSFYFLYCFIYLSASCTATFPTCCMNCVFVFPFTPPTNLCKSDREGRDRHRGKRKRNRG